jgi:transcriptional regulator with XRE-family HTH domain
LAQIDDAERFATRIRALKERVGLSFEELARRTGVSSSSLHRYCAGTKIPPSYGTVHAFAVACGAKGEELKELHKLWALAEASRSFAAPAVNVVEEGGAAVPPPVAERSRRGRRRAFRPAFYALLIISMTMNVVTGVEIFRLRSTQVSSSAQITPRPSGATAPVRVFNVEGDCKALKERIPACSLGLARNPYLQYGAGNEVAHRVWHNDVLTADCILYEGDMVRDETGVETTRWFRVRLNDVPGGFAWLPAVRIHDSPNLPTCYK